MEHIESVPQEELAGAESTHQTAANRFRWQVIPGTLQLIFGSLGLLSGPATSMTFGVSAIMN
jgi:hypothetical protein